MVRIIPRTLQLWLSTTQPATLAYSKPSAPRSAGYFFLVVLMNLGVCTSTYGRMWSADNFRPVLTTTSAVLFGRGGAILVRLRINTVVEQLPSAVSVMVTPSRMPQ